MAVCNDKVCNAKVACNECGLSLTPSMCGIRGLKFTESVCDGLKLIGADDVTINQGVGIDLSQGVHAYDGNGDEIEYTFVPSEIPKCAVGEHTVKYTVVGVANKMRPTICQRDRLHISSTCDDLDTLTKDRIVIIKQADPPKISGVEMLTIEPNTDFNPMSGVSAVDDNGVTVEVEFDGEYTKEASGEIASFETSLMKYMPKVEVSLEPIQDGTPWIDDEDYTEPYLLKASPKLEEEYNHESLSLVGGTVAWNQLFIAPYTQTNAGVTYTRVDSATVAISGTASSTSYKMIVDSPSTIIGHVYFADKGATSTNFGFYNDNAGVTVSANNRQSIGKATDSKKFYFRVPNGTQIDITTKPQIFDLTRMFGSTIADYIYSLEQANAGAGVAFFKALFPNDYYPYNQGQLTSVKTSGHKMVGFNQWDEEWESGFFNTSTGVKIVSANRIRCKNPIRVFPSTNYYIKNASNTNVYCFAYDAEMNLIDYWTRKNSILVTPSNCYYLNIATYDDYGTTYKNDICINISDPSRNGRYERYASVTYPLDSSLTLRGIPKLDASNSLYYDGDEYAPDGSVTRKYGIVDLGTREYAGSNGSFHTVSAISGMKQNMAYAPVLICSKYTITTWGSSADKVLYVSNSGEVYVKDSSYTDATAFKTAMSGVMLVYEKATPTTENADPYTSPQIAFSGGTEEFIDTREVPIPVGNKTRYMRIVPIEGHDEVTVHTSSNNLVNEDTVFGDNGGVKQPNGSWYIADQSTLRNKVFFYNNGYEGQFTVTWIHKDTGSANWGTYPIVVYTDGLVDIIGMTKSTNAFRTETLVTRANRVVDHFEFTYASNNAGYYYLQLELGSTATEYQPYQGNDYTTDLGQTVYGGTLDVASGKLVINRKSIVFDGSSDENWALSGYAENNQYWIVVPDALRSISSIDIASNLLPALSGSEGYNTNTHRGVGYWSDGQIRVSLPISFVNRNVEGFKAWLNANPLQVVYKLETPQTYWLTPQQVNAIVGENNVWSDNGDISVEYWEKMPNETIQLLEGVYHITYTAEDECGNKTEVTRDIIVGDGNTLCKARICEAITECGYS